LESGQIEDVLEAEVGVLRRVSTCGRVDAQVWVTTSHRIAEATDRRGDAKRCGVTCTSHRHKDEDTNLDFELLKLCSFVSTCTGRIDADNGWRMDVGGERVEPTPDSQMGWCGATRCVRNRRETEANVFCNPPCHPARPPPCPCPS
jgi:hypothetical protein